MLIPPNGPSMCVLRSKLGIVLNPYFFTANICNDSAFTDVKYE